MSPRFVIMTFSSIPLTSKHLIYCVTVCAVRPLAAYLARPQCQGLLACAASLIALDIEPRRARKERLRTDAVDLWDGTAETPIGILD